jgi:hypothetical protein
MTIGSTAVLAYPVDQFRTQSPLIRFSYRVFALNDATISQRTSVVAI